MSDITNAVRNSARAVITAFGGAVWVPSALRSSDRATTIRVKDVTITRIEGASDNNVSSATSCSARSLIPDEPKLIEISCASASVEAPAKLSVTAIPAIRRYRSVRSFQDRIDPKVVPFPPPANQPLKNRLFQPWVEEAYPA